MRTALLALLLLLPAPALAARAVVELWEGYGTPSAFTLSGRVLKDKGIRPPAVHRTASDNLVDALKVLGSEELPRARVRLYVLGQTYSVLTDRDGLFELLVRGPPVPLPPGAHPVRAELLAGKHTAPVATGLLRIHPDEELVFVLSDLDDTVLVSHVSHKPRLFAKALFRNAAQLEAVPGVAEAYRRAEAEGARFVYLSGSPINFHQRLSDFLRMNGLPAGPLLLKNYGREQLLLHEAYKARSLEALLAALPRARFVLVGDSTEQDPEVYRGLRERHPTRVIGVVIRRPPADKGSLPARLEGMRVLTDFEEDLDAVARLVRGAAASSKAEVHADVQRAHDVEVRGVGVDAPVADAGPRDEHLPDGDARP